MALFPPATVRQLAFQRDYREVDVAPNDRGHMLRFSHPAKRGCGGTTTEERTIQRENNHLFFL